MSLPRHDDIQRDVGNITCTPPTNEPVPDLRPGDLLVCTRTSPYTNAWCREGFGKREGRSDGQGCGRCLVLFLGYQRSDPPYQTQVWGHIQWMTHQSGRIDHIAPRALACFELVDRIMDVPQVIPPC